MSDLLTTFFDPRMAERVRARLAMFEADAAARRRALLLAAIYIECDGAIAAVENACACTDEADAGTVEPARAEAAAPTPPETTGLSADVCRIATGDPERALDARLGGEARATPAADGAPEAMAGGGARPDAEETSVAAVEPASEQAASTTAARPGSSVAETHPAPNRDPAPRVARRRAVAARPASSVARGSDATAAGGDRAVAAEERRSGRGPVAAKVGEPRAGSRERPADAPPIAPPLSGPAPASNSVSAPPPTVAVAEKGLDGPLVVDDDEILDALGAVARRLSPLLEAAWARREAPLEAAPATTPARDRPSGDAGGRRPLDRAPRPTHRRA